MRSLSNLLKYENIETSQIPFDFLKVKKEESGKNRALYSQSNKSKDALVNAKTDAERIITEANLLADEMKKNAEIAAKREYEEAKTKGFAEGQRIGKAEAVKENSAVFADIKQLFDNLEEHKNQLLNGNKKSVIELAYKIAEKVIRQKLSDNEDLFLKIYEKAVKDLVAQKWVKMSVSNADVQIATSNSEILLNMVSGAERLEIEVLDDAPRGTCIVETSEKLVDASVSTQLNVLRKATAEI